MTESNGQIDVYLEIGKKRIFAGALDWPGWCRSARTEEAALQALLEYAPRYARVLRSSKLGFHAPHDVTQLKVVERLAGNVTTDFGAPGIPPAADAKPVDAAGLKRLQSILKACWRALDNAADQAGSRTLSKGPRGGGRDTPDILRHVFDAESAYLRQLGWKFGADDSTPDAETESTQDAILEGLAASANGDIPPRGPRGGMRWSARYFVRRDAWHILDHAWEIEDRSTNA
jgi:hypothetical protein